MPLQHYAVLDIFEACGDGICGHHAHPDAHGFGHEIREVLIFGVRLLLCRFSDACMTKLSTRANSRRPKSAGARNRGVQGAAAAATYQRAMGI